MGLALFFLSTILDPLRAGGVAVDMYSIELLIRSLLVFQKVHEVVDVVIDETVVVD